MKRIRGRLAFWSLASSTSAFTLIEFLVVLGMVTLFIMVLLPALGKTPGETKWTVCRNNLRRLGAAASLYAYENRDYLAFPNWDGGTSFNGRVLPGWLYTPTNGAIPDPGPGGSYAQNPLAAYSTGLWFQYVRAPGSYLCPAGINSRTYATAGLRNNRLSTYVVNGAVCGFGLGSSSGVHSSCKITAVWNPCCYLAWEPDENQSGPENPGPFAFNDGAAFPSYGEGAGELHSKAGSEILMVQGNVQFVSQQKFRTESTASTKSLAWWSPFSVTGH